MEYADYHHAMAQHAAALTNSNQIHPAMAQIPMLSAAGLNLTVMSGQMTNQAQANQHHLNQGHAGHQVMYQNVQATPQNTASGSNHHHQVNHGGGAGGGQARINPAPARSGHSSKKNKKPKVNKDGVPAPKRATTAYINFTQWYREELKKSGRPIPKIGDFGKECAGKWNAMNDEEKTPFTAVANKDRERYKREMDIYKPPRDVNKPKRPGTAFMIFMGDFRKEMAGKEPEGGVAALAKLGGERWRNMTEDDKRPYVGKQNEEKVIYEQRMEEYRRKSAGMTAGPPQKQARLSTEGSEGGSPGDSDSGGGQHVDAGQAAGNNQQDHNQQQDQNMVSRQHQGAGTPSPATSSSSPQAQQTMSPSPMSAGAAVTGQQQQQQQNQHQAQSINNANVNANSNNMSSLPPLSTPMSLSHAITNHAINNASLAMAGYSQHSFAAANFAHPAAAAGVLAAGAAAAAAANYNQAHSGGGGGAAGGGGTANMTGNPPSYLPTTGSGGNYGQAPHNLSGSHYSWN